MFFIDVICVQKVSQYHPLPSGLTAYPLGNTPKSSRSGHLAHPNNVHTHTHNPTSSVCQHMLSVSTQTLTVHTLVLLQARFEINELEVPQAPAKSWQQCLLNPPPSPISLRRPLHRRSSREMKSSPIGMSLLKIIMHARSRPGGGCLSIVRPSQHPTMAIYCPIHRAGTLI